MKTRLYNSICAGILAFVFGEHQIAFATDNPASIPRELKPPDGNEVFLKAQAGGTQNYICLPSGSGMTWTFLGPQATLFTTVTWPGGDIRWQIATHFLSPNAAEDGMPRATWQSSLDTSAIWARAIASSSDPGIVAAGAIPWLLLQVVETRPGMHGGSGFAQTTFIQPLNTSAGVAPSTGCAVPADTGRTAFVPYSTDYYLYRSAGSGL